jgi:hypothetical protein
VSERAIEGLCGGGLEGERAERRLVVAGTFSSLTRNQTVARRAFVAAKPILGLVRSRVRPRHPS